MKNETWIEIVGYEGYYEVSNLGRIRSVDRVLENTKNNRHVFIKGRILHQRAQKNGYLCVDLHKEGRAKTFRVHRLVASAFVENPNGYDEVNHIDEDKRNNTASNLEWCTRSYNCSFGRGLSKRAAKCSKPCIQYKDGIEISRYPSIAEAARRTGINFANIQRCLSGPNRSTHGFTWEFA